MVLGDVDGDGDLDLLLARKSVLWCGALNGLFLNDGSGRFSDQSWRLPRHFDNTQAVALGDLDGDGDLDVLCGNVWELYNCGGDDRLYLNDGTGVFTDATANLPPLARQTFAIELTDVDGDCEIVPLI